MGVGPLKSAVFLDRDGVINALVLNPSTSRMESPLVPEDFRLLEGVLPALLRLQAAGYPLILVSNQPNYALGKSTLETLSAIHTRLVTEFIDAGIHFTRFCYCLHHPRGTAPGYSALCVCRKPSPWFLFHMRDELEISLADSWMIGDQPTDVKCGKSAGVRTIQLTERPLALVDSGVGADYLAQNLPQAVGIILDGSRR